MHAQPRRTMLGDKHLVNILRTLPALSSVRCCSDLRRSSCASAASCASTSPVATFASAAAAPAASCDGWCAAFADGAA